MSLGATAVLDAVISHAKASGLFERVNGHEPKNPPGNGLSCAVWADRVRPANTSGLTATSAQILFKVRVYSSMQQQPYDAIDPGILNAVDVLWTAYIGDLTLGDTAMSIDVRGMAGDRMDAQAGYVPSSDGGPQMRVMTITLPVLINDVWVEAP